MKRFRIARGATLTASVAMIAAAVLAAPARADDALNADYLNALTAAGITDVDPSNAIFVGQSVCPLLGLSLETMQFPDIASHVANSLGQSQEKGAVIAGIAMTKYCSGTFGGSGPTGGLFATA